MNRNSKLFIAETDGGEWWHFLSAFTQHYSDIVNDGEECDYVINEWTAGQLLDCNSDWKDEDTDFYYDPLWLWSEIRREIKWQRDHGITDLESAQRVFESRLTMYAIK